ncbi:MAG: hypothetical protein ACTSXG_01925 [Alphaproteobacteria bacterium]
MGRILNVIVMSALLCNVQAMENEKELWEELGGACLGLTQNGKSNIPMIWEGKTQQHRDVKDTIKIYPFKLLQKFGEGLNDTEIETLISIKKSVDEFNKAFKEKVELEEKAEKLFEDTKEVPLFALGKCGR